MKTISLLVCFMVIISFSWSREVEEHEIIDRLLTLPGPGEPVIFENIVIFTAPSNLRMVGVAFAHENFANIHRFRQLLVPQDRLISSEPYGDSGIQFLRYEIPEGIDTLEYRFVVNGLWTVDPLNPNSRRDPVSGLTLSQVSIPQRQIRPNPLRGLPDGLHFTFTGPPGEIVTVAGTFNAWDPFMYVLREGPRGVYSITIPLPPGTYQYVFYHRGERFVDPHNPRRVYSREGNVASEIVIR